MSSAVLLVDDDPALLCALPDALRPRVPSLLVETTTSPREALASVQRKPYEAVITDLRMSEMDGLALLSAVRAITDELPVVIMTGTADVDLARHALDNGAFDFLSKRFELDDMTNTVRAALRWHRLKRKQRQYQVALSQLMVRLADLETTHAGRDTSPVERHGDCAIRQILKDSQEHVEQSFQTARRSSERMKQTIRVYDKLIARQAAFTAELREEAYRRALSRFASR